jgi:hypothetical protein
MNDVAVIGVGLARSRAAARFNACSNWTWAARGSPRPASSTWAGIT